MPCLASSTLSTKYIVKLLNICIIISVIISLSNFRHTTMVTEYSSPPLSQSSLKNGNLNDENDTNAHTNIDKFCEIEISEERTQLSK